jgi:alkanesulfonate monooxygenase SsuD/methylene tetrahydromethanopterin reductase-like flavin-dependent oxidoreductase (luciferase family)
MPVELIGWIAPRVSSEMIPPSGPPFDAAVIAETARIHEQAGFDRVLIGYFSSAPDGFLIGAHAAAVTSRLSCCWRTAPASWRRPWRHGSWLPSISSAVAGRQCI